MASTGIESTEKEIEKEIFGEGPRVGQEIFEGGPFPANPRSFRKRPQVWLPLMAHDLVDLALMDQTLDLHSPLVYDFDRPSTEEILLLPLIKEGWLLKKLSSRVATSRVRHFRIYGNYLLAFKKSKYVFSRVTISIFFFLSKNGNGSLNPN